MVKQIIYQIKLFLRSPYVKQDNIKATVRVEVDVRTDNRLVNINYTFVNNRQGIILNKYISPLQSFLQCEMKKRTQREYN